jgi:ABC-type transporter Mla subunit MlaD
VERLNLGLELKEAVHNISNLISTVASIHSHIQESMANLPPAAGKLEKITAEKEAATRQLMDVLNSLSENDRSVEDLVSQAEQAAGEGKENRQTLKKLRALIQKNRKFHSKILETLQFQELTSQQIKYVGSLLDKIEEEFLSMAEAFGIDSVGKAVKNKDEKRKKK